MAFKGEASINIDNDSIANDGDNVPETRISIPDDADGIGEHINAWKETCTTSPNINIDEIFEAAAAAEVEKAHPVTRQWWRGLLKAISSIRCRKGDDKKAILTVMTDYLLKSSLVYNNAQDGTSPHTTSEFHTVYVWMPKETNVGHAALKLSDGTYISWWPEEKTKKERKAKIRQLLFKKNPAFQPDLIHDIIQENLPPDFIFKIEARALDLFRMKTYWEELLRNGKYSLLQKNCCWAVYQVLHAGGAPKSLTIFWRPETLRRYMVFYLENGDEIGALLNLPFTEKQEKLQFYLWEPSENMPAGHASVSFKNLYASYWDCPDVDLASRTLAKDQARIGKESQIIELLIFRLNIHKMFRIWTMLNIHGQNCIPEGEEMNAFRLLQLMLQRAFAVPAPALPVTTFRGLKAHLIFLLSLDVMMERLDKNL